MTSYFFVGIGGSGMLPLATILRGRGAEVAGSDRSLDQGRTGDKFAFLKAQGIRLFPQDGSGVTSADQIVVASAAVEETVPDISAAQAIGARRQSRAKLLAELFNAAPTSIAVGGTSGKSTTTGMIGWILHACGREPTVMNGAVMKNFVAPDTPFASALVGKGDAFVSEVDESDGSIALYRPTIAVVTNVTLDHKPMDELRELFGDFVGRAGTAIVNADDSEAAKLNFAGAVTYGFSPEADIRGRDLVEAPSSSVFMASHGSQQASVTLAQPGRHNASNALGALAATVAAGVSLGEAAEALSGFKGLKRRFEIVGEARGVTVIDDFAHNPDKIAATLATLHAFPGRLLIFFQPHGYGPLKVLKDALTDCFEDAMRGDDLLILSDPVYFGGTVDRTVGSADVVTGVFARGRQALHIPERVDCGAKLAELAGPGDRIVIMGARDDTLSEFAVEVLAQLSSL